MKCSLDITNLKNNLLNKCIMNFIALIIPVSIRSGVHAYTNKFTYFLSNKKIFIESYKSIFFNFRIIKEEFNYIFALISLSIKCIIYEAAICLKYLVCSLLLLTIFVKYLPLISSLRNRRVIYK